jgi:hypothetical protein
MTLPMLRRWLLIAVMPLLLLGCSNAWMLDRASYPEDRSLAEAAIRDLAAGNTPALAARLPAGLRPQLGAQFGAMRAALPADGITETHLVDASWRSFKWANGLSYRDAHLAYEIVGGQQRALAQFNIRRQQGSAQITTVLINRIDRPVAEIGAFRLTDISFVNFLVTALAIAAFAITIAAILRVWRSGLFRRRWLWILGCLSGLGQISTLWGSTNISFTPIYVQFLSAAAIKTFLNPWQISAAIPAIAIWALLRHRKRKDGADGDTKVAEALS